MRGSLFAQMQSGWFAPDTGRPVRPIHDHVRMLEGTGIVEAFSQIIEQKLMPIASKIGSNRILTIIRNAMCVYIALLIVGSVSILLTSFPVEAVANVLAPASPFFNAVYNCTTGMMGLFTAASIAYYAAVEYKADMFTSVLTSVAAFVVTQFAADGTLDVAGLGSNGLLTAMVVGFVTVGIMHFCTEKNIVIKMPAGVPPAVGDSFTSLIPAAVIVCLFGLITIVFNVRINDLLGIVFSPLAMAVNTPLGYGIYHMLCGLVFFCGINSAVVIGVVQPFIMQMGAANEAAYLAGEALPYADTMIWAGGTGMTIGLVILMSFLAKSAQYKTIGRMSVVPAIFNINEPVIFGTPICFNPIFFIPFVFCPGVMAFLTFLLTDMGIIGAPVVGMVPWTLPPVAVGIFMGAGNISNIIWSIACVVVPIIVYYPFFRMADNAAYKEELAAAEA